ncbi:hypothetical protein PVL29_001531 [Vitis rotundifolia]|uniref:beta-carotene 3-hydroxylase n=1 Tax=Vitis rotundifolia TaxID=103349 RepID=A0AA39AGT7_VITRO|nr:hypothetical protein PVL29_001531 [Vitis rotundifolia]
MATGISASLNSMSCRLGRNSFTATRPSSVISLSSFLTPVTHLKGNIFPLQRRRSLKVCLVLEKKIEDGIEIEKDDSPESSNRASERLARKKAERYTYLVAAMMSSLGITSMAIVAVYYRFSWQMEGGEIPVLEMLGTFALSVGAAVGMEFWARWAHKALWHASLWHMHESHHRPREGPFELNDVFAIINAVPAISLLSYGLFNKGLVPGLCFGAGLGITVFGMAYMFVHDGLVHRRFPVGPIANVPYLRKVASAHQLHHSDKFNGVPYGLFLGPMVSAFFF